MKKVVLILFCLIFLQAFAHAQYSRHWQGTDVPGHIQASFEGLRGTQDFKILASTEKTRILKYSITRDEGKLTITIKSGSTVLFSKQVNGMEADSINIDHPETQMTVSITGRRASGNFDIKYTK